MTADQLAELLERSETHRLILGNAPGRYSLGVTLSPDSSEGYALLLKVPDAKGVPDHVTIHGILCNATGNLATNCTKQTADISAWLIDIRAGYEIGPWLVQGLYMWIRRTGESTTSSSARLASASLSELGAPLPARIDPKPADQIRSNPATGLLKTSQAAQKDSAARRRPRAAREAYYRSASSTGGEASVSDADIRRVTGATILALLREGNPLVSPPGDFVLSRVRSAPRPRHRRAAGEARSPQRHRLGGVTGTVPA